MASGLPCKKSHEAEFYPHKVTSLTTSLELIQVLRDQIGCARRSEDGVRRRLIKQLSMLSDVLHSMQGNEGPAEDVVLYTEVVLNEHQRTFRSLLPKNALFPISLNERLKKMELDLIQVNGSLIAALALALNQKTRELDSATQSSRFISQNPEANFHANFPRVLKVPEGVTDVMVSYDKGNVTISWTKLSLTDIIDCYQIMRDDPSDIFPNISGYSDHVNLFYDPVRNFKPFKKYTIKIRAVNSAGTSNWSEAVIVCIKQAPPNKPLHPPELITFFCSSSTVGDIDSIQLSVPYPEEGDCNGLPLEKITLVYSNQHATEHSYHQTYKFLPENGQVTVEIRNLDLNGSAAYTVAVVWTNSAGDSPPSCYTELSKSSALPSPPAIVWETCKAVGNSVRIYWTQPTMNAFAVNKYEVEMMAKRDVGVFATVAESFKCSATIRGLKQRKSYYFRVFAVTASGKRSRCSQVIKLKTELSKNVREVLGGMAAVGGLACGTVVGSVVGPVVGPVVGLGAAVGLGVRVSNKVNSKIGKVVVGTSVALASALPMALLGTVVTPVLIPVCAGVSARDMVMGKRKGRGLSHDDDDED